MSNFATFTRSKDNNFGKYIFVLLLAASGSFLQIIGVSWDVTSHLMLTPETFFTPSHALLYTGVILLAVAAAISAIIILKGQLEHTNPIITSFRLFIIGSILAAIAGPSDFAWHRAFGVDGLLSPTHFVLATGIVINSVAVVIGLGRMDTQLRAMRQKRMIKFVMIPAFAAMWLTVIWYVYLFTLPLSNGLHFNFNLNPITESIIAITVLPIIDAAILLIAVRTLNINWSATAVTTIVVLINIFTNIVPSADLMPFLPVYFSLIIAAFLSDIVLQRARVSTSGISREKSFVIVGSIIGSLFYILGYPLLAITFAQPLGFTFHSMSELYKDFIITLPVVLFFALPFGALMGAISALIVSKVEILWHHEECIENMSDTRIDGEAGS
ncbi:MAG: hypothetical protein WBP64_21430 [Nitrososphaeraceae archaeon]